MNDSTQRSSHYVSVSLKRQVNPLLHSVVPQVSAHTFEIYISLCPSYQTAPWCLTYTYIYSINIKNLLVVSGSLMHFIILCFNFLWT